ncbi:MAG: hypothetical protein COC01_05190 [Bacteroidetes bacterium]|nr:MAG: hypothetical protein COC01_05190 [Bacteroidota bacterium]
MFYRKAIFTVLLLGVIINVHSQDVTDKIPANIVVPPGLDVKDMDPQDITEDNLRKAGATEAQIKEAIEYKKKMQSGEGDDLLTGSDEPEKINQILDEQEKDKAAEIETEEVEEVSLNRQIRKFPVSTIYGHSFFRTNEIGLYNKATAIKAPDNYILGIGDEINISIWGYSDYSDVFKINEYGAIQPKLVGRIYLKGMEFKKARSLLRDRFNQVYDLQNSQFEITLAYSRVISVNVVGEVFYPGTYTLPAINTAFNLLVEVGGPSAIGSLRKIYIKRGGKLIEILDVYKYLLNPDSDQDFFLENNDFIFVSTRGKTVKITGEVKRPHNYELLENENLLSLIKYAGYFRPRAFKENIQIKRFQDNKQEILVDINYTKLLQDKKDYKLQDGDEIIIKRLPSGITNLVNINGAVRMPGHYEYLANMTIRDLINKAEGLRSDTYLGEAYLVRTKKDLSIEHIKIDLSKVLEDTSNNYNLFLKNSDLLTILSKEDFLDKFNVSIKGAVRKEGSFGFGDRMTLKQLILRAGGLKDDAFLDWAYIIRQNDDLSYNYIRVELDTSNQLKQLESYELRRKDLVRIYSSTFFNDQYYINVSGLVRKSGSYKYDPEMTLADALLLSGGLKQEAANNRIEISRIVNFEKSVNEAKPTNTEVIIVDVSHDIENDNVANSFKLKPFDQIFVRKTPEFELQRNVNITGEVLYPGIYTLKSRSEKLGSVIDRAGGLTEWAFAGGATLYRKENNIGYIFLNLKRALRKERSKVNYVLKSEDQILIPRMVDLVHIRGEIDYPIVSSVSSPYHTSRRAKFFIKKYGGGFNDNAKRRLTYVMWPNGVKRNTHSFGLFNIYPRVKKGAVIIVASKPEKKAKEKKDESKNEVDWNEVIERLTIKITGVLTLWILINTAFN